MYITATTLYNYIRCPHRVWRDLYGPQEEKIQETNPFVELLWDRGVQHEKNVVLSLAGMVDLSEGSIEERFLRTKEEMQKGAELIYQGVLIYEDLLGIPDLIRRLPDGLYIPVDIKSGSGLEGTDDEEGEEGKPKKHYAVQLCLYVEILRRLGFAKENKGIILDIDKQETEYLLDQPRGIKAKETWWEFYETIKEEVKALMKQIKSNTPAMQSSCKMCPWYQSCKKWCKETDDLSCLPGLGRSRRDTLCNDLKINKVSDIITLDIGTLMERKKKEREFLSGLAEKSLSSFQRRASIFKVSLKPVLYQQVTFPAVSTEIFFDIEDDPTQEFVYLHGAYERSAKGERFHAFVAKEHTSDGEAQAWKEFWEYIWSLPENDYAVYYYSHHEKSTYKHMLKKHPNVLTESQLEGFFEHPNVIDLYSKVIRSHSDWPLWSYSLKDIATYLGFTWRDETPSGALSIQWYNKYLETNDKAILNRILEYNEDDCKATMILKDALVRLSNETKI